MNTAPQIDKPTLQFQYVSDAGLAQNVCSLDGSSGLAATCLSNFPMQVGTIAFWVKTASTVVDALLFSYNSPARLGGVVLQMSNPTNMQISLDTATTGPTNVAFNDDVWHRLLVSFERVSPNVVMVSIVKDAQEVYRGHTLNTAQVLVAGGDLYLGYTSSGSGLSGLVSELQVWDHALSLSEIVTGQLRRAVDGTVGLALHWSLDTPPPGNPNARIVPSDLRFRTGAGALTWNAIAAATAYEIKAASTDGQWQERNAQVQGTTYALPALPLTRVGAQVRALQGQQQGPWSDTVEIQAFELGQTSVSFAWDGTANALTAQWPDVPRRDTFTLQLYQDMQPPIVTTGYTSLTYDLTSKLDDPATWRLDVRASAQGSSGPAEPTISADAPNLTVLYQSVSQQLQCSWAAIAGAQYFRLQIVPPPGSLQPSYSATLNGNVTQTTITNTQYPLAVGTTYHVRLRALGVGTLSAWADVTLSDHVVAAPVLSWNYISTSDTLNALWSAVTPQATYDISVYQGSNPNPLFHDGNWQQLSYTMNSYLATNDLFRVLVAAIDAGVIGPTNQPIAPVALTPQFLYDVSMQMLQASWSQQQQDVYLRLIKNSALPPVQAGRFTTASASFSAPPAQFPEGTMVDLNLRGMTPGALGAIESAQVIVHLLTKPIPILQYTAQTAPTLMVSWPAINPPLTVTYQIQVSISAQNQPIQTLQGLSADVTSLLSTEGAIVINIRSTADGSVGPWSDAATAASPTNLGIVYDQVAATITLSWDGAAGLDALYCEIWPAGATTPAQRTWFPGTATTTTLNVPFGAAGQMITVKVRAVAGNVLSAFTSSTLTLAQIVGPALMPLSSGVNPNQITANWTFDSSGVSGTVSGYLAQLSQGGQVLTTQPVDGVGTLTYQFTEALGIHFAIGTTYTVSVRARIQPAMGQAILGSWSQPASITFGLGNLTIQTFQVTSDTAGNFTLNWSVAQQLDGMTFEVQIPTTSFDRTGIPGSSTSLTLAASDTHVSIGTTYTVQIRAVVGTVQGSWNVQTVTAGQPEPPPNPPQPTRGDPVNLATGAFLYSNVDLLLAGATPLEFAVSYRSDSPLPGDNPGLPSTPIGSRWNHSYNTRIQKAADGRTVAVIWGDLVIVVYNVPPSITGYYQQQGISDSSTLHVDSTLNYLLTRRDQSRYFFNPQGVLQWIQTPVGNQISLMYSGNQLSLVTDTGSGRYLEFSYDQNGRIQAVSTSVGTRIAYTFDASGNLTQYADPLGNTRTFTYDSQSRILTTTDQRGLTFVRNTYDSATGKLTFQQDARALAEGQSYGTTFQYSEQTQTFTTVVTDRLGHVSTTVFDKATRLRLSEVNDLGGGQVQKITLVYDGNGNIMSRSIFEGPASSTSLGNTWTYTYDGNNNQISVTDPLGGIESATFNAQNQRISFTDRLDNTARYSYANNLLMQVTDALGQQTTFTYKAGAIKGLIETVTDVYGAVTRYLYDDLGQVQQVTDAASAITDITYNNAGWPLSLDKHIGSGAAVYTEQRTINAMGWITQQQATYTSSQQANQAFTTITGYDADGNITSVTDPLGYATSYSYDPAGLPQQITYPTPSGPANTTTFTYNREDQLSSVNYGASVIEQLAYDALGRTTQYTDPNGNATSFAYSMIPSTVNGSFNTLQTITLPINAPGTTTPLTQQIVQDALGRTISATNTAGGVTSTSYIRVPVGSAYGLQTVITLPKTDPSQSQPYTTGETRDALGRLVETIDAAGKRTTLTYALASTLPGPGAAVLAITTTRPSGRSEIALYDGLGRMVEIRRGSGNAQRSTKRSYDALGRTVQVIEASGGATATTTCTYSYNNGLISAAIDAYGQGGQTLHFDGVGHLVEAVDQATKSVTYTYTPRGLVNSFTNARLQTLSYSYDAAARLTGTLLPANGGSITHQLDHNGNRLQTSLGGMVKVTRTFDPLDRLLSRIDDQNHSVSYAYDAYGNLATLGYPGQNPVSVQYTYDGLGQLTSVRDWANRTTTYAYYPGGALQSSQGPNNVSVNYSIDDDERLKQLTTKVGAITIADASYGYNDFDEVVTLREILPVTVQPKPGSQIFAYQGTRLTSAGSATLSYDDDGNMTSLPTFSGTLSYDVFNELVQAGDQSFQFDVDGLRESASLNQDTRSYLYDVGGYANPWREQANAELTLSDVANVRLPPGGRSLVPILGGAELGTTGMLTPLASLDRLLVEFSGTNQTRYVYGNGLTGAEGPDGQFSSYVFDGQGSTLALIAQDGTISARHAYDLFGAHAGGDPLAQPFGFVGRYGVMADSPDLLYMRSRSYVPSLLRFSGQDYLFGKLTDPQSLNGYLYVGNNPLLQIDPLGEDRSTPWGAIIGSIVAIIVVIGGALALPEILGGLGAGLGSAGGALSLPSVTSAGASLATQATRLSILRQGLWSRIVQVLRGNSLDPEEIELLNIKKNI